MGDAASRHRQPPLPGARPHGPGRGAARRRCHDGIAQSSTRPAAARRSTSRSRSARHATERRKIVSIVKAYHGHTGLAVRGRRRPLLRAVPVRPAGRVHRKSRSTTSTRWTQALRGRDVAAVIMETIPATYGFPMPAAGLPRGRQGAVRALRRAYIADEVQTGLMRTGEMWAITKLRRRARHPGHRQGHQRRALPDRLRRCVTEQRRRVAGRGRLRATSRPAAAPSSAASSR